MQYSGRIKSQVLNPKNIHEPVVSPLAPIVPVSVAALEPQSTQLVVLLVPPMLFVPVQTTCAGGVELFSSLLRAEVRLPPINPLKFGATYVPSGSS